MIAIEKNLRDSVFWIELMCRFLRNCSCVHKHCREAAQEESLPRLQLTSEALEQATV